MLKFCAVALGLGMTLMLTPNAFAGDIVGSWHLDEGQGSTVQDSSGNSNAGTLKALGSTTGPTWIDRRFDNPALRFGGLGSVEISTAPVLEPQKITVEAWIRRSPTSNLNEYVLAKGAKECVVASYALYTVANSALAFYVSDGNKTYVESPAIDASKIWNDRWHHVAGTYDGKMVRLYVDGIEQGNGTPTTLTIGYGLPTNNNLFIGSYPTGCVAKFGGDIDDVRIWNRALTPSEIKLRKAGY
jgi:Concanavalin A-like lectin/glucanases superfamily